MSVKDALKGLLLVVGLATCLTFAWAAPRAFPSGALRGTMQATIFPQVTVDGKTMVLAPGAKIYGKQNTIVMHSTLVANPVIVNYTLDAQGYIKTAWILTDEELAVSN